MRFADEVEAGVWSSNGGTHGSEPHMASWVKQSGTGWREAGIEALDVYTDWKYVQPDRRSSQDMKTGPCGTSSHFRHGVRHQAVSRRDGGCDG